MTTFTIDTDNNITAWDTRPADAINIEVFATDDDLAALAINWPSARLVEIWNSLTGVVPVKRFTSRSFAVSRIWKQIQYLQPVLTPQTPKAANGAAATEKGHTVREGSKKAAVLDLLGRPHGASLDEVMTATGWQAHTVRGFISGTLTKRMGLAVESVRSEGGVRTYRIAG